MFGFLNDLTKESLIWCKGRALLFQSITLISLTIVCCAAIDQYLSTSYYLFLRQKSTKRLAQTIVTIASIICILHGTIAVISFEIRPITGCAIYNVHFQDYAAFFYYLILTGILPTVVSSFFSALAYRNVRRIVRRALPIRRRKLDQQLTAMVLARVAFLDAMTLAYILHRIYVLVTPKTPGVLSQAILQLCVAIATALYHLNFAGSFYVFIISSTRFRRQCKYVFMKKIWEGCYRHIRRLNQIVPTVESINSENESS